MADDKSRCWHSFGKLIHRHLLLKQSLHVPRLGTFSFASSAIFTPTDDPSSRPPTNQASLFSLTDLAALTELPVESTKAAFDQCLSDLRAMTENSRKRLPDAGEFLFKSSKLSFAFDRPKSRMNWEEPISLKLTGLPPRTPLKTSRSIERLMPAGRSTRVDFLIHNQAKLLLALRAFDPKDTGMLPFPRLVEAVSLLENPMIQSDTIRNLVDSTNTETEGIVDYRKFLSEISKFKSHRGDMSSSHSSPRTDFTANYDFESVIPFVRKIWEKKLVLVEFYHKDGLRPRLKVTASEVLSKLKKAGMRVNLHQLHAVIREAKLNPVSVSLLEILQFCREILNDGSELSSISEVMSDGSESRVWTPAHPDEFLVKIRHFFTNFSIDEVIAKSKDADDMISSERFMTALTEVGGGRIRAVEAQKAFYRATGGVNEIHEEEFRAIFEPQASKGETQCKGFRVLREWLRRDKLTSEQAFQEMLHVSGATEVMNRDQFLSAVRTLHLNSYDAEVLFQVLDTKQDAVIDLGEWCNKVFEEFGPYQSLRDVVLSSGLSSEDLLIKMNIGNRQRLSSEELAAVLQTMDTTLTAKKAVEIATAATHRHGYVDVQDFFRSLSQDVPSYDGDWKDQIYKRIQQKIKGDPNSLRKLFEQTDTRNTGKLGLADFQDCVFKAEVGLEAMEIERLARVLDRQDTHQIDYYEFLNHLKGPNLPPQDPLKIVADRIVVFLNQNAMTAAQLLKRLGGKATYQAFVDFLASKVHKTMGKPALLEVVGKIDINHDGFIDLEDLTAILSNKSRIRMADPRTYPVQPLPPAQAHDIMRKVSQAFVLHRFNFANAFRMMDKDNTGMLTAQDWADGLNRVIELSKPIKDGLFATMDVKGIGLIDYPTFLKAIREGEFSTIANRDNWSTEDQILADIKTWIARQRISIEAAFRAFDKDFDGVVSKSDLKESLNTLLKVSESELPSNKLDRLYKLMDTYKRNSVQLPDFKVLFEEAETPEWKTSAKQQLGVFLSKEFSDMTTGFETLSQFSGKLTFGQFQTWIFAKNALAGFNITQDLLQQLFAEMDSHRKGYLTLQDWSIAFSAFHWREQHFKELTDAIRANFSNPRVAFDYFVSFEEGKGTETLSKATFVRAIHKLIPKRFTTMEAAELWKKLTIGGNITFEDFTTALGSLKYLSEFSQTTSSRTNQSWGNSRTMTAPSSSMNNTTSRFRGQLGGGNNPVRKFYDLMQASATHIDEVFAALDPGKTGKLTSHEFRQAVRTLNLGLTSRDIDRLIQHMDSQNNGTIDYIEVLSKCQASDTEARIKQVASQRLARLRTNMFEYLLSPTDAFKQFDESRCGHLTFGQFNGLVKKLCEESGDEEPSFAVVKDLFELIDTRKDGVLDLKEWANAFKAARYVNWEDTQQFEDVCSVVARNRKMLQSEFEAMSETDLVSYAQAKQVLSIALKSFRLSEDQWRKLLKIADRSHNVNFRVLLEIFKERSLTKTLHPRPS